MRLVTLSDLHLSRYGETGTWSQREDETGWETLHTWQRWTIEGSRDKKNRPEKLRLVDPGHVVHKVKSWPRKNDDKAIGAMLSLAMERHLTSAEALIQRQPTTEDLGSMLRVDPVNTNLLFIRLLGDILPLEPDLIAITGDVTDNGFGYTLVEHYFKPWIERGRLLVIPGNHDTYDMFPRRGRRKRANAKEERYRQFADIVGMKTQPCGAWFTRVGDIAAVGLSSCKPPLTPLSASGEVTGDQLSWLGELRNNPDFRDARLRIGMVHHHLLRMPFELGKRSPIEMGIRLRNAPEVMEACRDAGIDMVFNGHRHHGYIVQLPGHPMVISSPSSTLGCKSTDLEYVWTTDLSRARPHPELCRLTSVTERKSKGRSRALVGR
ncbi:MAG: metallophosphoesterase [Myxococcales bacterium]|nr:metallophosphoesterase [Myxococcales bacterium]